MQLADVIDPEVLFRDYIYVTGTSETMAAHNREYADDVARRMKLSNSDLVVEVASNDGSLLKCFGRYGCRVLGIEPATNIARIAEDAGIPTLNRFLDLATAEEVAGTHGLAKSVLANNVLAHVDSVVDFLRACSAMLAPGGILVVEVPYLGNLINGLEYDTIYHEHLSYFSVTTVVRLAEAAGLTLTNIDHVPVHGGSLRIFAQRSSEVAKLPPSIEAWISEERRAGMAALPYYERFADAVHGNRQAIRDLLRKQLDGGHSIAAYGAPAKGNTLLNFCEIDASMVSFVVDKNPLKVGRYTPGTHLPVLPAEALLQRQPNLTLILAWNFAGEIMRQQQEYRSRGGRFILPLPEPEVVAR